MILNNKFTNTIKMPSLIWVAKFGFALEGTERTSSWIFSHFVFKEADFNYNCYFCHQPPLWFAGSGSGLKSIWFCRKTSLGCVWIWLQVCWWEFWSKGCKGRVWLDAGAEIVSVCGWRLDALGSLRGQGSSRLIVYKEDARIEYTRKEMAT